MLRKSFLLLLWMLIPAAGSAAPATAEVQPQSKYFQDSGSRVDTLFDRIRFKISYSWMKSGEYFRLAMASTTDGIANKKQDLKSRAKLKKEDLGRKADEFKDELVKRGKNAVRENADELARKTEDLKKEMSEMGEEFRKEAAGELDKNRKKLAP